MKPRQLFSFLSRVAICCALLPGVSHPTPALCSNPQSKPRIIHRSSPIFIFYDDEFWLNLHHFLYVLGRAENKTRDSSRAAVSGAPADQQQGMGMLTENEQAAWRQAVHDYAAGPSRKDIVFDDPLPVVTIALARAHNAKSLSAAGIDSSISAVLMRAAPIYRKAWWSKHLAANKAWRKEIQALVKKHGAAILGFISNAYQMEWPAAGYGVHLSSYTNWAGAYSTTGNLLVVASLNKETMGEDGLETVFHEGMHQWDDLIDAALHKQAPQTDQRVLDKLSHALIFFTAGYAVRRVIPEHTPYADRSGVWQRGWLRERDAVNEIWKPYLDGHGTRDEALAKLVKRLSREAN